jgi:hypothetical protein
MFGLAISSQAALGASMRRSRARNRIRPPIAQNGSSKRRCDERDWVEDVGESREKRGRASEAIEAERPQCANLQAQRRRATIIGSPASLLEFGLRYRWHANTIQEHHSWPYGGTI